jgi:hypothetical protein
MKTAGGENPKRWATTSQQPSPWRGRSEQISFVQMGCEARKLAATGEIFFLTSPFIELIGCVRIGLVTAKMRGDASRSFHVIALEHVQGCSGATTCSVSRGMILLLHRGANHDGDSTWQRTRSDKPVGQVPGARKIPSQHQYL